MAVQSSQKLGYRLEHLNIPTYLNVLMGMPQSPASSRLLNEIIVNPDKTIEHYCEKASISRSSSIRRLKQCNQILESHLLKVIVDQSFQLTSPKSEPRLHIFVTFFFLSYYGKRTLPFPVEKKRIKEIMVKNNCQVNLFQEGSPYKQSLFIMYFAVHLMGESQGTPFEWKAGDSYIQLINIDKKGFLILKNPLGKLKYSSYMKVMNYFVNIIFSEFSEKGKNKIGEQIRENMSYCPFSFADCKEKNEEYVVQLLTQVYLFSRIFPYDTTHLTIRAACFAQQTQHRQICLYAGFRAELQFYSTLPNQSLTYYLSSYVFWMFIGSPEIYHYTSDEKILIISGLGLRHNQYIEKYINNILAVHRIHSETATITEDQLSRHSLLEYGLIVTSQLILDAYVLHILIGDSVSLANEEELIRLLEL